MKYFLSLFIILYSSLFLFLVQADEVTCDNLTIENHHCSMPTEDVDQHCTHCSCHSAQSSVFAITKNQFSLLDVFKITTFNELTSSYLSTFIHPIYRPPIIV